MLDTDGAESTETAWTADEFIRSTGAETGTAAQYYLLENRSYVGNYEDGLRTGPYNFGWAATKPDWVQQYSYRDGMLVWYVNHAVADNNTSQHPGAAYALPIDANPAALKWSSGDVVRGRIQMYDATFGLQATDGLALQREVGDGTTQTLNALSLPATATFDDTADYYDELLPYVSVTTAGAGVTATVTSQTADTITVSVANRVAAP
ncbi:immune inhibitor A [Nocardioides sp. B-3]|uniref:immune inhibitor A n=1 Tax=Nocardioides sp. B-3 TaxID=2895565 RepID=UPI0021538225|nr:immune inhibitor A [Nocardioides sp. B-3]UUZ58168.1 immune inhibitor A [Nocardioides sp. B-3]